MMLPYSCHDPSSYLVRLSKFTNDGLYVTIHAELCGLHVHVHVISWCDGSSKFFV